MKELDKLICILERQKEIYKIIDQREGNHGFWIRECDEKIQKHKNRLERLGDNENTQEIFNDFIKLEERTLNIIEDYINEKQ